jgi:hypothetical protein
MFKTLKGVLLFTAMIAVPIVLDNMASRHPSVPLNAPDAAWFIAAFIVLGGVGAMIGLNKLYGIHGRLDKIAGWLQLAERDFNSNVNSGLEHGGRKGKAAERAEWNRMAQVPFIQIYSAGYRTVAHEAFELNEKDLAGKGAAMGKASITAFLLRELYEGNVNGAQMKVYSDVKNGGSPYVAPGIREIIGYDEFDKETGFPKGAGESGWDVKMAAKVWGYPRSLLIVRTAGDKKTPSDNWQVLTELTQYVRPEPLERQEPEWKLWHIAWAVIDRAISGR